MRPLLLNTYDIRGGAARAAYRLHRGLRAAGIESQMLVQSKSSDDPYVEGPRSRFETLMGVMRPQFDILPTYLYPRRGNGVYYPGLLPGNYVKRVRRLKPDIVHLHWVAGGFLHPSTLVDFGAPVVWTLHDMWAFTGGCHYDNGCGRYVGTCGKCPALGSSRETDLSRWVWQQKRRKWTEVSLTVVTPSRWLADCARKSSLFSDKHVEVIPNGLDLSVFRTRDKQSARELLGLPAGKQLILFGTLNANMSQRKGSQELQEALQVFSKVHKRRGYSELVIVGASKPISPPDFGLPVHYIGILNDDVTLALLASAVDVVVVPSLQENLSNTVMEALACGTPCVAFNIGGMPDLIEHQRNGYLAKSFESRDLAHGMQWILENQERWCALSKRAREKVEAEFALRIVAERYLALYLNVLDQAGYGCGRPKLNGVS
ncbi:MAG: glycosyltransferase family 4 protein [Nitrospira sp.]|nr:glycosyltransferase family 4 protein [Nitrospira sp.]